MGWVGYGVNGLSHCRRTYGMGRFAVVIFEDSLSSETTGFELCVAARRVLSTHPSERGGPKAPEDPGKRVAHVLDQQTFSAKG